MNAFPTSETIKLDFPLQLADRIVEEVTIKRPNMRIISKHLVSGHKDVSGEMRLIGTLCGLRMEEMKEMDSGDYFHLQDILNRFQQRASKLRTNSRDSVSTLPNDALES